MSDAPTVQGWCPGALRPMMSGDGLVVRIRPPGGRLSPVQTAGIADLSRLYGNGLIDLSSRANLQLRGVTEASHPPLIEGLAALGLVDPTPEAEAARNLIIAPFWREGDETQPIATELASALCGAGLALPSKFGFAVDCGLRPVLRASSADIRIERAESGDLLVVADGMITGAAASRATVVPLALALAQWFAAHGMSEGRGRMAALIARGAQPPIAFTEQPIQSVAKEQPRPGMTAHGPLVAFEFGQTRAETLAALAPLGPLRLTPWRMVLIEGAASPAIPGVITDPDDPALQVTACTGAPGCLQGHQPTRELARDLAQKLARMPAGITSFALHVSGCAKGCAHPAAAPLTLTATRHGFAVIRDGTAAGAGPIYPAAALAALLTGTP